MDILATRRLSYPDGNGDERELILTVFMPFEAENELWTCGFVFDPPIHRKNPYGAGIDVIQAFVDCLLIAHIYFKTTDLFGRAHWQGMLDCGLPDFADKPASWGPPDVPPPEANPGNLDVLSTRRLGYPDESGVQRDLLLTVFVPFKAEGEKWKCGVTFGPPESAQIHYGVGEDFIEAFLDGVAMARVIFEQRVPKGWRSSGDLLDCTNLPYKIGRSFWTERGDDRPAA
jgi:hypothetical protein